MTVRKKISILGSTGSIGVSTLDVCRQHPDRFEVLGLAAGSNVKTLAEQISEFKPKVVSVRSEELVNELKSLISDSVEIRFGEAGAEEVAGLNEVDLVVSAIVGAAGLRPTLRAIENGKDVALANKETMVIAGEIVSKLANEKGVNIIPVDSEHSAIFQCLNGEYTDDVKRLILTASGGPFLKTPKEKFSSITKEQALKHPNWDMGAKITIDSASMMNKGLEVMEARWLFDMPVSKIDVVVHPQSIIHSMVEFVDGSVMSQMGMPDMRVPIAYALTYPRRITTEVEPLHLPNIETLTFFEPDFDRFRCLKLAFDVAKSGKSYAPVLNAANEEVVAKFLNDRIHFTQIPEILDECLQNHDPFDLIALGDVLSADQWARSFVTGRI